MINPVDAWIDAIPEDPYAPCPCGCGMKWRFVLKTDVEEHEKRFLNNLLTGGKEGQECAYEKSR